MALKLSLLPVDQKADRAPELDVEKVKVQLAGPASDEQPTESAVILADELERLNHWKVEPTARWHLLEEYFNAAAKSWPALDALYANVPHPMRGEVADAADAAMRSAAGAVMGYNRILADLTKMSIGFGQPKAPALLIHRCQQCLARVLTVSYMSFRPVPPSIWFELHQIYLLARDSGMATVPYSEETPAFTPEVAYIQVLLLSLANPYGFLPGQISLALTFLGDYAHLATLTDSPPVHRMASALAVVPVTMDKAPIPARKVEVPKNAVALYLHCYDVVFAVNRHVQELEAGTAWPAATVADTISQQQYLNFVERLLREWGVAPVRQELRSEGDRAVTICAGLGPIFRVMLEIEESRRGASQHGFEPAPRAECVVVNQTDGGYSLRLESMRAAVELRVGEVVGLIEPSPRKVPVAVVRWLRFDRDSGQTQFGLEVLSASAELTKASMPSRNGLEFPTIVFPPVLLTDEHSTLIVSPGLLTSDTELVLGAHPNAETVIVTRLLEQTTSFERFEFIPVA